jgi:hypothetical protein
MASPIINEIMMDVFSLELPKGTRLFKGTDAQALDMSRKGPVWLTLNKSQCKKYGKNVLEFVTNRKLKLINITSHIFRMHFLDQVNISIGTNDSESLKLKEAILHPSVFQIRMSKKLSSINMCLRNHDPNFAEESRTMTCNTSQSSQSL